MIIPQAPNPAVFERAMKRTTVILHPGALGDVLLAVPAMKRLRAKFSQHEMVLIARASVSRFLSECRVIHEGMPFDGQACAELFSGTAPLRGDLHSWLKRCDVAVAWTEDKDGALASLLQQYGVPQVRIQSPFSPGLRARHQRDRFLETLGNMAGEVSSEDIVEIPSSLLDQGNAYLDSSGIVRDESLVILHPGSGSTHKCVRPETIALLLQHLQQRGLYPVILEGPADHDVVTRALTLVTPKPPILRDLDLPLLAGVLVSAGLYIGHDSGITHLSALLGVRTIAVFGPTDHHRWAPRGDHVTIWRGAPCACPTWEVVKACHEKPCLDMSIEEMLTGVGLKTVA
jgi:heptosyltransferase III